MSPAAPAAGFPADCPSRESADRIASRYRSVRPRIESLRDPWVLRLVMRSHRSGIDRRHEALEETAPPQAPAACERPSPMTRVPASATARSAAPPAPSARSGGRRPHPGRVRVPQVHVREHPGHGGGVACPGWVMELPRSHQGRRVVPISQRIADRLHRPPVRSRSPLLVPATPSVLRGRRHGCAIGPETARHHASTGSFPAGSNGSPGRGNAAV